MTEVSFYHKENQYFRNQISKTITKIAQNGIQSIFYNQGN